MHIKIAARFKPFSHTPGACCVIPKSCAVIQAFPTLLRIEGKEWKIPLTGPVDGFTLEQDLEKSCVFIFGRAREGYFRIRVEAADGGVHIRSEKGPLESGWIALCTPYCPASKLERLSLGSHRAQDWDAVQKRGGLKEILPILFCLGQQTPSIPDQPLKGTARLLDLPAERTALEAALTAFTKAAFKGILVPRLIDDQYQGLVPDESVDGNPFFLLEQGAKVIRSLFFTQNERRLAFLPRLPISFDCGRMVGIEAPGVGTIDFEWSKKILKKAVVRPDAPGEVILDLQNEIKTFRVNRKREQKKEEPLLLQPGHIYHLDRFEK